MLRHDIKLNNKHDFKFIFRWNELFRVLKVDSIKRIYVLKELNEIHLDEIYAENRLKRFRTRNVWIKNAEEKELNLTLIQKDAEEFEKRTETAEENFKEKFKMLKKEFDQIEELKENQWDVYEILKDAVMSINEDNETLKNNIMNIRFNYNVVRNVAVIVKIKNWKLRDAAWAQNFRNKQIKKDAFDEDIKILTEKDIIRAVND